MMSAVYRCEKACTNTNGCTGYTFHRPSGRCWFKAADFWTTPNPGHVSKKICPAGNCPRNVLQENTSFGGPDSKSFHTDLHWCGVRCSTRDAACRHSRCCMPPPPDGCRPPCQMHRDTFTRGALATAFNAACFQNAGYLSIVVDMQESHMHL